MYPYERSLVQKFQSQPFVLLGVNDDEPDVLKKLIAAKTVTWRCLSDHQRKFSSQWRVNGWPTIYLIDRKGVIRYQDPPHDLEGLITSLLNERD
jgi:peroxiredoxin